MIHMQSLCLKIEIVIQDSILGLHAFTGCDVMPIYRKENHSPYANYIRMWKLANIAQPDVQHPEDNGWKKTPM